MYLHVQLGTCHDRQEKVGKKTGWTERPSASKVYQCVDGISKSNCLAALGQLNLPAEKVEVEEKKDDNSIDFAQLSSNGEHLVCDWAEASGTSSDENDVMNFQDDYKAMVEEYADLRNDRNGLMRIREGGDPSLAQVEIKELKGDIDDLKAQLRAAKTHQKVPAKFENQLEIEKLKSIICSLKQRLDDQELHVYANSLEHDVDVRVEVLERELKMERKLRKKLQRENNEFQRFLLRDKKCGDDTDDF